MCHLRDVRVLCYKKGAATLRLKTAKQMIVVGLYLVLTCANMFEDLSQKMWVDSLLPR